MVSENASTEPLPPVGGAVPRDVDGDGAHHDLNVSGRIDGDDVVLYFEHLGEPVMTDRPATYDVNGNDRIDFDDVVQLFQSL